MALPTTISGISTTGVIAGPFISSGGNVYFFGRDGTTATTLQAYKATDPTTSFSSIATQTGYTTQVSPRGAAQVDDVIHLALLDGASISSVNLKYIQFDMAADVFQIAETVQSGFDPTADISASASCSIAFRGSDSQPVILYNGAHVASMGTSYARIVYARRTGTNTWTTNVAVDAGGTTHWQNAEAILGSSNRIHFFWYANGAATVNQRALNSSNVLQTASAAVGSLSYLSYQQAVSYDASGTQKIAVSGDDGTNAGCIYFDSADTVTLTAGTEYAGTTPARLFNDGADFWLVYRSAANDDLYARKSTDYGSTFGSETNIFTGTVSPESGIFNPSPNGRMSLDGNIFLRGSNYVIPYVVNDNGTLKYNEYIVRTVVSDTLFAQSVM